MGRLIQGTAQPKKWCWSQKWFLLARVEVCRTLLGSHHLPLLIASQPCEEAETSRLSIRRCAHKGVGGKILSTYAISKCISSSKLYSSSLHGTLD